MDKPDDQPDCCQGVDGPCDGVPTWRRQNTEYADEIQNWVNMCDPCFRCIQAEWDAAWRELAGNIRN